MLTSIKFWGRLFKCRLNWSSRLTNSSGSRALKKNTKTSPTDCSYPKKTESNLNKKLKDSKNKSRTKINFTSSKSKRENSSSGKKAKPKKLWISWGESSNGVRKLFSMETDKSKKWSSTSTLCSNKIRDLKISWILYKISWPYWEEE